MLGDAVHLPRFFAWPGMVVLVIVLVASVGVYRVLVVRWTVRKHWFDLQQWADERGMKLRRPEEVRLPGPLEAIKSAAADAGFTGAGGVMIVSFHTPKSDRTDTSQFTQWHVLARPIEANWEPTGLRPRANKSSVIDLFQAMTSFPSMAPPERFVIFGVDSGSARRVAKSTLLGLMPGDVGLLLFGGWMILDFSSRPFDGIELTRMAGLGEQLAKHLPAAPVRQAS